MKKALASVLAVIMASSVVLAGCGGGGSSSSSKADSSKADSSTASTDSKETSSTTGEAITYDSPDISWRKDTSPVTFDTYIDYDWYELDTWGQEDVSKEITKRTGVSLNVTKSSDRNQLQVLLAADELPEIIFTDNQVERFFAPEISFSFDELMDQYCPEFKTLVDPVEIVNNTAADGHFYTLKSHYNSAEAWDDPRNLPSPGDSGLYVRQDIMEEMGNPKLESLEDFQAILKTVKEKYPKMVPYIPHPTWGNAIPEFMGLQQATSTIVDTDGQVKMGFLQTGFEKYPAYMNELFLAGCLSGEAYTYKPEQFFQIVRSGDVFAASYNTGLADETNKIFDDNGIKGHFVPVTVALSYQGKTEFEPLDAGIGWSSTIISKKCKNPERAIRYMEFLKSPEGDALTQWGIEGKHFTFTEDKLLLRPEGFSELKTTDTGIGPWYFMASGLGEGVAVSSRKISNPKYASGVDLLQFRKKYYKRDPALFFTRPAADTDELNIKTKLEEYWKNSQVGIYTAATPEESKANWEKFLADAKTIGVDRLTEHYTKAYNDAKAKYANIK